MKTLAKQMKTLQETSTFQVSICAILNFVHVGLDDALPPDIGAIPKD